MSNLKNYLFTSESVSEGHPDKVSDRISDMVVDSYLAGDPFSRVACETLTTTNKVVLAGEVRGPEIKQDELIDKDDEISDNDIHNATGSLNDGAKCINKLLKTESIISEANRDNTCISTVNSNSTVHNDSSKANLDVADNGTKITISNGGIDNSTIHHNNNIDVLSDTHHVIQKKAQSCVEDAADATFCASIISYYYVGTYCGSCCLLIPIC